MRIHRRVVSAHHLALACPMEIASSRLASRLCGHFRPPQPQLRHTPSLTSRRPTIFGCPRARPHPLKQKIEKALGVQPSPPAALGLKAASRSAKSEAAPAWGAAGAGGGVEWREGDATWRDSAAAAASRREVITGVARTKEPRAATIAESAALIVTAVALVRLWQVREPAPLRPSPDDIQQGCRECVLRTCTDGTRLRSDDLITERLAVPLFPPNSQNRRTQQRWEWIELLGPRALRGDKGAVRQLAQIVLLPRDAKRRRSPGTLPSRSYDL